MTFNTLNLHPLLIKSVNACGYKNPTSIQEKAIPLILQGKDLYASSQTGTGKTAAFILPILNKLIEAPAKKNKGPKVLIIAPTRELAMQIDAEANKYCKHARNIKTVCVYGGVPYQTQKKQLYKHYDILVATPGRLIDLIQQRVINLSNIDTFVIDEADRMVDMGFIEPVTKIANMLTKDRQTLLFTATLNESVIKLSKHLLNDPVKIHTTPEKVTHENIEQRIHRVDNLSHKHQILDHLLKEKELKRTLIFTSTKSYANQIVDDLKDKGYYAGVLHGDIRQQKRSNTIAKFKNGKLDILVATDVASRGIDVFSINHVINFDLPQNAEDYVHRIGRTGRAGKTGVATSFVSIKDNQMLRTIEQYIGLKINTLIIPGLEAKNKSAPKNSKNKRFFNKNKPRFKKKRSKFR